MSHISRYAILRLERRKLARSAICSGGYVIGAHVGVSQEIVDAAETVGFFILVDQESPSKQDITEMFNLS